MTTQHVGGLVDGYLLGALEEREAADVSSHLDACADCQRELGESAAALALLADEREPLSPSPSLKRAILRDAESGGSTGLAARRERGGPRTGLAMGALGMAAVLLVGIVGGLLAWAFVLRGQVDDRDEQLAEASAALGAIVRADDILTMESEYNGNDVVAAIAVEEGSDDVVVLVENLPPAPAAHGYRLWLFSGDQAVDGGVLSPNDEGSVVTQLSADLSQFDRMELDFQPLSATAPGGETVIGGPLR